MSAQFRSFSHYQYYPALKVDLDREPDAQDTPQPHPGPFGRISGVSAWVKTCNSEILDGSVAGLDVSFSGFQFFSSPPRPELPKSWHRPLTTTATMQRPSSVTSECPALLPTVARSGPFPTRTCPTRQLATHSPRGDSGVGSVNFQSP